MPAPPSFARRKWPMFGPQTRGMGHEPQSGSTWNSLSGYCSALDLALRRLMIAFDGSAITRHGVTLDASSPVFPDSRAMS
jgi:hypothetical protein